MKGWRILVFSGMVLFLLTLSPTKVDFYRLDDLSIPPEATPIVYGSSGEGRNLLAYKFGDGENVMVIGFAIHGYEDNWEQDAEALVYTAGQLMEQLSQNIGIIQEYDWTVYILPCMNPDGFYSGRTKNGPGRRTTRHYNSDDTLVVGGIDLNRSFPHEWVQYTDDRYFNGSEPLAAEEARSLAQFIETVQGTGNNILIDTHGWMSQIITSDGRGLIYRVFKQAFPGNTYADLNRGNGYFSAYAADLGYDACLFEFPDGIYSLEQFVDSGYYKRFNNCITKLLRLCGTHIF